MVWGTNKDLASHISENPNIIQYRKQDRRHLGNSLKYFLKVDDDRISWIEDDNAIDFCTQRAKEWIQLIPGWMSSTSVEPLAANWDFSQMSRRNPSCWVLNCRHTINALPWFGSIWPMLIAGGTWDSILHEIGFPLICTPKEHAYAHWAQSCLER